MEAIRQTGDALRFASDELTNDKEVILEAMQNGLNLEYASKEIRNNKEVVLEAVKQEAAAL